MKLIVHRVLGEGGEVAIDWADKPDDKGRPLVITGVLRGEHLLLVTVHSYDDRIPHRNMMSLCGGYIRTLNLARTLSRLRWLCRLLRWQFVEAHLMATSTPEAT